MTIYFTAGGLLGSAWVNTLQLAVMLAGFAAGAAVRARRGRRLRALHRPARAGRRFGDIIYSVGPGFRLDAALR